jgi:hypothetical protein
MNGVMTMAFCSSGIGRASSAAAVQDTDARLVGSGSSAAVGQRAAEHMPRPRTSLAGTHAAERAHTVTAHTPGRTTDSVLRTDVKAPGKRFSQTLGIKTTFYCPTGTKGGSKKQQPWLEVTREGDIEAPI